MNLIRIYRHTARRGRGTGLKLQNLDILGNSLSYAIKSIASTQPKFGYYRTILIPFQFFINY